MLKIRSQEGCWDTARQLQNPDTGEILSGRVAMYSGIIKKTVRNATTTSFNWQYKKKLSHPCNANN
ncbi:MAG: hypothetical protein R2827_06010 [Bdellovibrionales bacterium]